MLKYYQKEGTVNENRRTAQAPSTKQHKNKKERAKGTLNNILKDAGFEIRFRISLNIV